MDMNYCFGRLPSATKCKAFVMHSLANEKPSTILFRGVVETAFDILEGVDFPENYTEWNAVEKCLLNGSDSWSEYNDGGMPLAYTWDILIRFKPKRQAERIDRDITRGGYYDAMRLQLSAIRRAVEKIRRYHKQYLRLAGLEKPRYMPD